ncbi:hypothetical protein ACTNEW_01260 [Blautia sp. HCP3S3_G3]|uniref:hypothetical protein n=1 Tax=Blautia sp. HCP3S3_G3 TaxID=3438913 RepID=UPI003F8A1A62
MKKKLYFTITVILSVLLCVGLVYNLIAGAPVGREAAIRYIICAIGFSIIVSGLSGYSIYRIFNIKVADDDKETVNKAYQGSLLELVSAFEEENKISKSEIDDIRKYLDDLEE